MQTLSQLSLSDSIAEEKRKKEELNDDVTPSATSGFEEFSGKSMDEVDLIGKRLVF